MEPILHRASERGLTKISWLTSYHSFSFGDFQDPNRMGFGKLRVINDDTIAGGGGFATHSHRDMEIVSIALEGSLLHRDSMGNEHRLETGDVQHMSAGSGVSHSEYNGSPTAESKFLQIWIQTDERNRTPRYGQKTFPVLSGNHRQLLFSPDEREGSLWIGQRAFLTRVSLEPTQTVSLPRYLPKEGLYVFVISGRVSVDDYDLKDRDALGMGPQDILSLKARAKSDVLVMEVPL